jgi:hypothetical protein
MLPCFNFVKLAVPRKAAVIFHSMLVVNLFKLNLKCYVAKQKVNKVINKCHFDVFLIYFKLDNTKY